MEESKSSADKDKLTVECVGSSEITNKNSFPNKNLTGQKKVRQLQKTFKRKQSLVKNAFKRSKITNNNSSHSNLPESGKIKLCESSDREKFNVESVKGSASTSNIFLIKSGFPEPDKIKECISTTNQQNFIMGTVTGSLIPNKSSLTVFSPAIIKIQKSSPVVERKTLSSAVANVSTFYQLSSKESSCNSASGINVIPYTGLESNISIRAENTHKCVQVSPECYDKSTVAKFPPLKQELKVTEYRNKIRCYQRKNQRNLHTIERLKEKLKGTKEKIVRYETDPYIRSLSNVLKHAEDGDNSALYIQDLVLNYKKNKFKCVDIPIQNLVSGSSDKTAQLSFLGKIIKQHSLSANPEIADTS